MRQTIIPFASVVTSSELEYRGSAVGRERADGIWEGNLVFESPSGDRLVSGLETTQPNAPALEKWAAKLEHVYLEGALRRARTRRAARAGVMHSAERRV
jgi:hypothetical protein